MNDAKIQRYCAMGGIAFVVLGGIGTAISGSPPSPGDPAGEILDYFKDHDSAIKIASYLSVLATFALLFWVGALWATLRRAEGGSPRLTVVAGLGAAVGGASAGVSFAVSSVIALRVDSLGPGGAKFFYGFSLTLLGAAGVGIAALVLATSIISLRSGVFPSWVTWGGMVLGVLWLVAASAIATDRDFVGILGLVSFVLWCVWIVAISVLMLREGEPATA